MIMRLPGWLGLFFSLTTSLIVPATALNREAFTITKYDLEVRLEPEQQRLGARGKITLRNDSGQPQKIVALQISSSLNWRSIRVDGKTVQFVSQPYTSDIDHTGALSEAIVTLPARDQAEGFRGDRNRLRRCNSAGCDAADRESECRRELPNIQVGTRLAHRSRRCGARVCGVVSDYDRVGGFFGGEQSV